METQPDDLPQGLEMIMSILFFLIPFLVLLFAYFTGKIAEQQFALEL